MRDPAEPAAQPIAAAFGCMASARNNASKRSIHGLRRRPLAPTIAAMKPSRALSQHRDAIRQIVARHRARNPRVFGSALRGEDAEGSDLDLLVDTQDDTSLFDLGAIQHEVQKLVGLPVDVVTPRDLPESFRDRVVAEAAPL